MSKMKELTLDSASADETRELGALLGETVQPGDVILLSGELGAGKTVFVQGLADGLAVPDPVSSKSFVLMGEYHGRLKLYHADLYRLEAPEEAEDLALSEYCTDGPLVVEWPERAWQVFPEDHLLIRFDILTAESRQLTLEASGKRPTQLVAALEATIKEGNVPE